MIPQAINFVFGALVYAKNFLMNWNFYGIPILYWFIAFAIMAIILDAVF